MQPQRVPINPSAPASLAATKAFGRDRDTTSGLSNAAAAQALRTHVITPTPVGDTVTKRMARRNSASSNGSSARPPPNTLRRHSSSGSMTERSFRAPSPARGSPAPPGAPPVPPVPQHIPDSGVVHRRASSLEPSSRGTSPAPRVTGRVRGSSVDSGTQTVPASRQPPTSGLAHVAEEEGTPRSSVNFSRPMSPGLAKSKHSASPQTGTGWFTGPVLDEEAVQRTASPRPKSSSGLSNFDAHRTQYSIQNAADRPVKKHHVSHSVEGTRLANGGMRAKPSGTALHPRSFLPPRTVDPNSPDAVYDPSSRTFIHKQDAMARHRELHEAFEEPEKPIQQYVSHHVDNYRSKQRQVQRSPAPIRQSVQYDVPLASQRRDHVAPQSVSYRPDHTSHAPESGVNDILDERRHEDTAVASSRPKNIVEDPSAVPAVNHASSQKAASAKDDLHHQVPDPIIPVPATAPTPTPTNTVASENHGRVRTVHDSRSSLSPPRSAHFAPVAVELDGEKHKPPPRSSSPAKSALKSSPSVSNRDGSPVVQANRLSEKGAPSDVSDTTSDDGAKKRRSMRVSFEATPVIAGISAYPDPQTPVAPAGLGTSKWSPISEKENEFEDLMKPRAALPVFGSIRTKERRSPPEDFAEKITETVSSTPMTASVGSIGDPSHSSNDHALGNIVAQDFAHKQNRLEESGYVSDSSLESSSQKHGDVQSSLVPEPKSLTAPIDEKSSTPGSLAERIVDVPNIALLPPTPNVQERSEPTYNGLTIPGGWDDEAPKQEFQAVEPASERANKTPPIAPVPAPHQHSLIFNEDNDSDSDNSSVYSDAYEDLTDAEGGFGSIDAMVERPVVLSPSGLMSSKYADKATTGGSTSKLREETSISNDAELVASRKQPENERKEERSNAATPFSKTVAPAPVPQSPPKPLKSALKKATPVQATEPQMKKTMRGESAITTRAPPSMRSSMRGSDTTLQAQPQMRKSMRGADSAPQSSTGLASSQQQMRKSMRESEPTRPTSPGLAASRHSMVQSESKTPRGALQKRHIPAAEPIAKSRPLSMPGVKPMVIPAPTYDSDSDGSASSFRRERSRANRNQGGRYTMRGSMRNNPAPTMRSDAAAPRPTPIRAISPPVSPSPAMRKSLRPSSPTQEPSKSSKFRLRSLSPVGRFRSNKSPERESPSTAQSKRMLMPAFGKQAKQKPLVASRENAPKAVSKSRIVDSSDEEDDEPRRRFQSRFVDSDSDDGEEYRLPPDLTPVRGIPRRAGEEDGDSTDLEEEEDHEKGGTSAQPAASGSMKGQANGTANGKGPLSGGSLRDSKHAPGLPSFEAGDKAKSKRGFFGLGRKKTVSSQSEVAPPTPVSEPDAVMQPTQQNRPMGLPLTPIEEDKDFGPVVSDSPEVKETREVKTAPKLQRRSTPEWPLPSPISAQVEERPMSSDGVPPRRPRFQMRQASTTSNVTAPVGDSPGRTVSFGRDGKKKKFQGLRRVFGIND